MRECICGKSIPRRKEKGHREREYCSDACRKRAWRAQNKDKHNIEKIKRDYEERFYTSLYQDIHRETWQDELEKQEKRIDSLNKENTYLLSEKERLLDEISLLESRIDNLHILLAHDRGEIARLTTLLDAQSKKKKPQPKPGPSDVLW